MAEPISTAAAITALLKDPGSQHVAASRLLPLVYDELRQLARARVAKLARGHTLRATELVHEAWMRVVAGGDPGWHGRAHFFGAAANAMRNILVEQARRRSSMKRDASRKADLPTDVFDLDPELPCEDVLTVHEALLELEKDHERPARVVTLRFFGGLSMPEIAKMLAISLPTAERDWRFARSWLQDRLGTP
ncbi:MAG TPA: ECF-type sigma factor [Planctomycetota bacterium]|nr:ECF-type sigma factor [Planctomycetota bacterium]